MELWFRGFNELPKSNNNNNKMKEAARLTCGQRTYYHFEFENEDKYLYSKNDSERR